MAAAVEIGLPPNVARPIAVQRVEQVAAGDHAADREAVAQPLGEGHHVRGDAVVLDAPEVLPGPAPAGLHLVGDEQDAVLVEDLLERREQAVRRHREATDALDRLGDQRRDVTPGRGRQHMPQVLDAGLDVVGVVKPA